MRNTVLTALVSSLVVCATSVLAVEPTTNITTPTTAPQPTIAGAAKLEPRPCALMSLRFLRPSMLPKLTKDLGLTSEQVAKLTEILTRANEAMKPMVEDQRNATAAFANALTKPDSTQESLIAAFDKAMKAESVLAEELIRTLCKLRELLTDSQKANFAKFVQVQINPWVKEASDYLPKPPAMPNPLPTPPAAEEGK